MVRGTFANVRLRHKITPEKEGGYTKLFPENKVMTIYDAAVEYKKRKNDFCACVPIFHAPFGLNQKLFIL